MSTGQQRVAFTPFIVHDRGGQRMRQAEHLTNEQWLRLMYTVNDNREGWLWAPPAAAGDPVRVLPPGEDWCWRFDANGDIYREEFHAE